MQRSISGTVESQLHGFQLHGCKERLISRRMIFGSVLAVMASTAAGTIPLVSAAVPPDEFPPDTERQRIDDLVIANHILADTQTLDSYGHVTVRSLEDPSHYYMSRNLAPGSVTVDDIREFDRNSELIGDQRTRVYNERYIHGEIYRARPDVQAIIHCHAPEVLPFTVTDVPLRALIHMAHFIGDEAVPVFDLESVEGPDNDMLVTNSKSGAALAAKLGERTVVLMRGHGMTVVGPNVRRATYNAVYTQLNARVQMDAMKLGRPKFMNEFEVKRKGQINRAWDNWAEQVQSGDR